MTLAPIYAALIALLFLILSARVIVARGRTNVAIGDGDDLQLRRLIRAQGNCAEYAPFGLLLIAFVEMQGQPGWLVHLLGLMLLVGRVGHGYNISRMSEAMVVRIIGTALTLSAIGIAALTLLGSALF